MYYQYWHFIGTNIDRIKKREIIMKTLGNIIWFIIVGLFSMISWGISGVILCITIIGIPFGKQCFKIAGAVMDYLLRMGICPIIFIHLFIVLQYDYRYTVRQAML